MSIRILSALYVQRHYNNKRQENCRKISNFKSSRQEEENMKKRNVGLAVLFSIITFGIYGIYWFICLTNDSNTICPEEKTASGGLAFLFTIISFGIYGFYWNYKLGKKLTGSGTLYLILSIFCLSFVNYILAQLEINKKIA